MGIVSSTETAKFPQFHGGFWSIRTSYVQRPAIIANFHRNGDYDRWAFEVFQERFFDEIEKLARVLTNSLPLEFLIEVKLSKQRLEPAPSCEEAEINWKFECDHCGNA